jgi:thiamine-phosphate pyrophosphorylase
MKTCVIEHIKVPVIAIGGIKINDVEEILATGVYGIAVSSAISNSGDVTATAQAFIRKIKK